MFFRIFALNYPCGDLGGNSLFLRSKLHSNHPLSVRLFVSNGMSAVRNIFRSLGLDQTIDSGRKSIKVHKPLRIADSCTYADPACIAAVISFCICRSF